MGVHRIGIDIGGVLMQRGSDSDDTSFFSDNYLTTPEFEGAFEVLRQLVDAKTEVWLVSKCGEKIQAKTESWLAYHKFYEQTGVSPEYVLFTRERKEKLEIANDLGLTHFIDDRLEILSYMVGSVPYLYLFNPDREEVAQYETALPHVKLVQDWYKVRELLLPSSSA